MARKQKCRPDSYNSYTIDLYKHTINNDVENILKVTACLPVLIKYDNKYLFKKLHILGVKSLRYISVNQVLTRCAMY